MHHPVIIILIIIAVIIWYVFITSTTILQHCNVNVLSTDTIQTVTCYRNHHQPRQVQSHPLRQVQKFFLVLSCLFTVVASACIVIPISLCAASFSFLHIFALLSFWVILRHYRFQALNDYYRSLFSLNRDVLSGCKRSVFTSYVVWVQPCTSSFE